MIDRATIDRILDATRIEEVIGDFISLKKKGTNYWGLCPFHQDKHASLAVSATKGIFKCFSCGKAGTAVSFLMEQEHLTYPEALRYLAGKYHIEIEEKEESAEEAAHRLRYESLLIVNDYAQKFYQDILWNNDYGRAVGLSYFRQRKFTDETIRKFGLGFASNYPLTIASDALKKGYKEEFLIETGLCIKRENGSLSDRFFERVMFPIHSISGRVIAFGGRTLRNDKDIAKYVNSPQSEVYDKSRSLYGIYFAKNAIIKNDKCILVEGYADVISMHQAGIENVVASSGTSLTVEQIRLIKRFTENITIIYDGDQAGIKAAVRGTDMVLEEGMHVKIVLLPPEDDPDSFAKSHAKEEVMEYIAANERDFICYKSDLHAGEMDGDPIKKSQLINDIIRTISVIPDPILRNVYVDMVAERFNQDSAVILRKIAELREKKKAFDRMRRRNDYTAQGTSGDRLHPGNFGTNDMPGNNLPGNILPGNNMPEDDLPEDNISGDVTPAADGRNTAAGPKYAITDWYLGICEKEIIYYLLKFGTYVMHFEENIYYGNEKRQETTVETFIRESLEYDGISMANLIYRDIYNEYFTVSSSLPCEEECEVRQQKIIRYFTTHADQDISSTCLGLILEEHPLTVKTFEDALVPEHQLLGSSVPKSVDLYKVRVTDKQLKELQKQIMAAQKSGDVAAQKELISQFQMLNRIKNQFSRHLNRV